MARLRSLPLSTSESGYAGGPPDPPRWLALLCAVLGTALGFFILGLTFYKLGTLAAEDLRRARFWEMEEVGCCWDLIQP